MKHYLLENLLWVDCVAAAIVGVGTILLHGFLVQLFGLPSEIVIFIGLANILYGSYSFSLALRAIRPLWLIKLLVFANLAWVPVCMGLIITYYDQATPLGLLYILLEAIFVGGLAFLEWNRKSSLLLAE